MATKYTMEQYAAMNASQREKIKKPELLTLPNSQIGQPTMVPEDTLRNIIKNTIDRSIEEKIPEYLGDTIDKLKEYYDAKIELLQADNKLLKKTILEQQKFLEGMRREKTKNNVFVSGIPESYTADDVEITDKKEIIKNVFTFVNDKVANDKYSVVKVFDPAENRTRYSAKVVFTDYESKMAVVNNCKKLGTLDPQNPWRKVRVRFDDPPLTRKENKRLFDRLHDLIQAAEEESEDVYKLTKGKLLKDGVQIDEFNLNNQIFA